MNNGFSIEDFVLKVAARLSPAFLLGARQFNEQKEAAIRLDKLKEHADRLRHDALDGKSEAETTTRSRGLQDEILESRKRSPLVFDAIYRRLQSSYETQMNHGVAELVGEAIRKLETQGHL